VTGWFPNNDIMVACDPPSAVLWLVLQLLQFHDGPHKFDHEMQKEAIVSAVRAHR
jgi:hypothetical protein